jgi:hypothetical protein
MPCNGGPSGDQWQVMDLERNLKEVRAERSKLEILLCSACRVLAGMGFDFGTNPGLDRWWDAHEKEDLEARRKAARERLRHQQALHLSETKTWAQMTPGERALVTTVVGLEG